MRNLLLFIFLLFFTLSCQPYSLESRGDFLSKVYGNYVGVYVQPKNGAITYLDTTKTSRINFEEFIIDSVIEDSLVVELTWFNVYMTKKMQKKKRSAIYIGKDENGNDACLRMTLIDGGIGDDAIVLSSSNLILGDYDSSKDTVDIYYKKYYNKF